MENNKLEQAAKEYAKINDNSSITKGFSVIKFAAFKAGAEWQKKEFAAILDRWEKHAILGMQVGASAYHQGKIALICDLREWLKEGSK